MAESQEFSYELKIPKERVAVLIGKDGITKKFLEAETKTKLSIDSGEGDVFISGNDAITLFSAREVVKAIGRGFNPDISMLLLKSDYVFELINLPDLVKSENSLIRIKGRVIGHSGRSREIIEELTDCNISVYGKTIGIIGRAEKIGIAKQAVDSLILGSPHASVYKWLEKKKRDMRFSGSMNDDVASDVKDKYKKQMYD